jgi:hypothetical protein
VGEVEQFPDSVSDDLLRRAKKIPWATLVVLGQTKEGTFTMAAATHDNAETTWLLALAHQRIMRKSEGKE